MTGNLTALVDQTARAFPEHGFPPLPAHRWTDLYRLLREFTYPGDPANVDVVLPEPVEGQCPRCRQIGMATPETAEFRKCRGRVYYRCVCGWTFTYPTAESVAGG